MTTVTVLLGSAQGPVQLLREALGRRLRDDLRRRGVAFVDGAGARRSGADVAAALADERAVVRAVAGRCRQLVVVDEWDAACADRLADVARAAGEPSVQVVVHVERQDRLVEHTWSDAVRAGDTAVPDAHDTAERRHDHAAAVRALEALPCVDEVRVRPYELVGAGPVTWVDDVLARLGLRDDTVIRRLAGGAPLRAYRTYTRAALELGRELQQETRTPRERELVHSFLLASFPAEGDARLLDETVRQQVVVAHRELNAALFTELMPDLPVASYADDRSTAQLARVLVPARVAVPVWSRTARRARSVAGRVKRDLLRRTHRAA